MNDDVPAKRESVSDRFKMIEGEIVKACQDAERARNSVKLVAVSKQQDEARIDEALKAGQRVFGENRVQEAYTHWETLRDSHGNLELHLIGHLQTNKCQSAWQLFDVIQTLDRPKLATAMAKARDVTGVDREIFIQVNTGEEPQKGGVVPDQLPQLLKLARQELRLSVTGLMCLPPRNEAAGLHFGLLNQLKKTFDLQFASMGMSADYESAIKFGATHVRVGRALFGERPQP